MLTTIALYLAVAFDIYWLVYAYLGIATWVLYLSVMRLQETRDGVGLTKPALIVGYIVLAIGLAHDCAFNFWNTPLLWELPQEWLFTPRCSRHCHQPGWKGAICTWYCDNALDRFAPGGKHCSCKA
ncbi:MAG: hypothetical protein JWR22_1345 [Herminiimonas sp.]|nr:hypothetical protein [Herminiimonas sp.]